MHLFTTFFQRKSLHSTLSLYAALISCKKSKQFQALILDKTGKTSFQDHFGHLSAQKSKDKIFVKKVI